MNSVAVQSNPNPQGAFNVSVPFAELDNRIDLTSKWFPILHPVVAKAYTWAHDWYRQYNPKDFGFTHNAAFHAASRLWTDELASHHAISDRRYTTREFAAMTYYITRDNTSRRPLRFKMWVCPHDASAPHHHTTMRYDVIVDFYHPTVARKRYTLFWKALDWHTLTTANLLSMMDAIAYRKNLEAQAKQDAEQEVKQNTPVKDAHGIQVRVQMFVNENNISGSTAVRIQNCIASLERNEVGEALFWLGASYPSCTHTQRMVIRRFQKEMVEYLQR